MSYITPPQVQSVQIARGKVKKLAAGRFVFDESDYQNLLRNCDVVPGPDGRRSSKRLTQSGYEKFMAIMEGMGYRHPGRPDDYWRSRNSRVTGLATTRQVFEIVELAKQQQYTLEAMCFRISNKTHTDPAKLTFRQAYELIEALKKIINRQEQSA